MTIYKKVSGPDDVMTFCGEKKTMGEMVRSGKKMLINNGETHFMAFFRRRMSYS